MVAARVEQLFDGHAALVRSICCALLRDRVEAEDAVQQTFLSAHRALLNGSSPRDPVAWLATIARNESLARVRARMREPLPLEVEEREASPDAHAAAVRRHQAGELRDALAQLPLQQREAILLREVRGLSYQEVAAALSVTTSAVESLLFRARRSLQTRLQEVRAAFSPGGLVRELAARLGGGLAGPAAAKVAAVGLGTAVVTGGAVVGPTVLGLGHAPRLAGNAARPPAHRVSHASSRKPVAARPSPVVQPVHELVSIHPQREDRAVAGHSGVRAEGPDRESSGGGKGSDTAEREHSATNTDAGTGDRSAGARPSPEAGDNGATQAAADSTDDSEASTTGGSSPDFWSNTTTTGSGTPGD